MSIPDLRTLPTTLQLWKASGIAFLVALVVLTLGVLPAEYGIDPTGLGGKLGLTKLAPASAVKPPPAIAADPAPAKAQVTAPGDKAALASSATVLKSVSPFRSETMALTLKPGEGAEIKATMRKGDQFVFGWVAENGKVEFDMHGEAVNARNDEFTSYWKGVDQAEGHGSFTAPFDGTHGWYWNNTGKAPVTVRVKVSGFFEKLQRP